MVKKTKNQEYSCSICGVIPNPSLFSFQKTNNVAARFAYFFENGELKFPLEKRTVFNCCGIEHLLPFHSSSEDYLESVKELLPFHVGEWWVDKYIYNNQGNSNDSKTTNNE
jgi:hypothetical protein